jgi:hypothetical protein
MKLSRRFLRPCQHFALLTVPVTLLACGTAAPKAAPAPAPNFGNVEKIIDAMLAEERALLRERGGNDIGAAPPVVMPEVAEGEVFSGITVPQDGEEPDTFGADVLRIQETVPTWNNGTGIALQFLRLSSGQRVSLIYVDPTPPAFSDSSARWVIQATARGKQDTLGHFVLLLKDLTPGHYHGSAKDDAVVMSTSMGEAWDAKDPDTTWSVNEDSSCELVLKQGAEPSILEGHFRAKLFDNQGTGFHHIESGYIFIKR